MDTRITVAAAVAVAAVLTLILATTRSPNVAIAVTTIAVLTTLGLGGTALVHSRRARGWRKTVRTARWQATSRDVHGRTEIYVERVAEYGDRREVLGTQHVEWMDAVGQTDGEWDAAFAEAWGRAQNRAIVRNAEINR